MRLQTCASPAFLHYLCSILSKWLQERSIQHFFGHDWMFVIHDNRKKCGVLPVVPLSPLTESGFPDVKLSTLSSRYKTPFFCGGVSDDKGRFVGICSLV